MTTELLTRPTPTNADFDDDLVHSVCGECERALCDGGECNGLTTDVSPDDLECVVCNELDERLDACPYCSAPLTPP